MVALLNHHNTRVEGTLGDPAPGRQRVSQLDAIIADGLRTFAGEIVAGRFRIVRFLAAAAWARSTRPTTSSCTAVALKTIRPDRRRRRRPRALQARDPLARKVTHPHVCAGLRPRSATIAPTATARSILFLTMELLAGETLAERIRAAGRCARRGAAVAAQWSRRSTPRTARASSTATSRAATSCSCRRDRRRGVRVVVTDFGLARHAAALAHEATPAGRWSARPPTWRPSRSRAAPIDPGRRHLRPRRRALRDGDRRAFSGRPRSRRRRCGSIRTAPSLRPSCPAHRPRGSAPFAPAWSGNRQPVRRSARGRNGDLRGRYARRARLAVASVLLSPRRSAEAGGTGGNCRIGRQRAAQAAFDGARVRRENVTRDGYVAAIAGFRNAIDLDPRWSQAWAELAYTYAAGANAKKIAAATAAVEARNAARAGHPAG